MLASLAFSLDKCSSALSGLAFLQNFRADFTISQITDSPQWPGVVGTIHLHVKICWFFTMYLRGLGHSISSIGGGKAEDNLIDPGAILNHVPLQRAGIFAKVADGHLLMLCWKNVVVIWNSINQDGISVLITVIRTKNHAFLRTKPSGLSRFIILLLGEDIMSYVHAYQGVNILPICAYNHRGNVSSIWEDYLPLYLSILGFDKF